MMNLCVQPALDDAQIDMAIWKHRRNPVPIDTRRRSDTDLDGDPHLGFLAPEQAGEVDRVVPQRIPNRPNGGLGVILPAQAGTHAELGQKPRTGHERTRSRGQRHNLGGSPRDRCRSLRRRYFEQNESMDAQETRHAQC